MKKFCVLLILVMTLSMLPTLAFAEGAYLKIDAGAGEPPSPGHEGWFKLLTYRYRQTQEGGMIGFTYDLGKSESLPAIRKYDEYQNCVIDCPRNTPEGTEIYRYVFSDVQVRSVDTDTETAICTVEMQAGSMTRHIFPPEPPETGDSASPLLWAALSAAGICCAARVLLQKRRRTRR